MKKIRIIPRLDVKGSNVVKGIQFEGLRIVGKPAELARKYYLDGADELLYIDTVASLYGRNNLAHIIEETIQRNVFIPITVGGGIRNLDDIDILLRSGADKVAINTAAVKNPELLVEAAKVYGSSTIVLSVEAKKISAEKWEVYVDNGREKTGLDVVEWIKRGVELGVGEILITSVDQEGTRSGYDMQLIKAVSSEVTVPIVVSGGAGNLEHIEQCLYDTRIDGVAIASLLHYKDASITEIRESLFKNHPDRIQCSFNQDFMSTSKRNKTTVSIVDYNLGNLRSVVNAFKQIGACPKLITTSEEILKAKYLVLPGVGSFGEGVKHLKKNALDKAIIDYAQTGRPLLGICLGMQLLMTKSFEFGEHKGLNLIEGDVVPFKINYNEIKSGFKIPHIGWNTMNKVYDSKKSILPPNAENHNAYFIHSFYVKPKNNKHILALTNYFEYNFCSIINKNNIYGCQFHPEKSGQFGLAILNAFLQS